MSGSINDYFFISFRLAQLPVEDLEPKARKLDWSNYNITDNDLNECFTAEYDQYLMNYLCDHLNEELIWVGKVAEIAKLTMQSIGSLCYAYQQLFLAYSTEKSRRIAQNLPDGSSNFQETEAYLERNARIQRIIKNAQFNLRQHLESCGLKMYFRPLI